MTCPACPRGHSPGMMGHDTGCVHHPDRPPAEVLARIDAAITAIRTIDGLAVKARGTPATLRVVVEPGSTPGGLFVTIKLESATPLVGGMEETWGVNRHGVFPNGMSQSYSGPEVAKHIQRVYRAAKAALA